MKILLIKDGKEVGPFTLKQVQQWIKEGVVPPGNLAWREGLPDWVPVSDLLPKKVTDYKKLGLNALIGILSVCMLVITGILSAATYFAVRTQQQRSKMEPENWRSPQVYEYQHDNVDYVVAETRYGVGICPKSSWKGMRITVTNTVENFPLPEIALEEYQPKETSE